MLGTFTSKQDGVTRKKRKQKSTFLSVKWPIIRRFFFYPLCFLLLIILVIRIFHTNFFPISVVQVIDPLQRISHQQLQAQIATDLNKGFFNIDLPTIQKEVMLLPWVKNAQVSRRWPNKLVISVQERKPLARWGNQSLLDTDGQLFTPVKKTIPQGLPQFTGPADAVSDIVINYTKFSQALAVDHLTISAINVTNRMSWSITLNTGTVVNLGRKEIVKRLQRFASVYDTIFASVHENAKYVDMRYSNAMAVRWQDKMG